MDRRGVWVSGGMMAALGLLLGLREAGARLAELYELGAPIEERRDLPEGVLLVARLPRTQIARFAPYVVSEARSSAARGRV